MLRAQAVALSQALEGQGIAHTIALIFPQPGVEQWNVALPTNVTYSGATLTALTQYCATNGLTLSVVFSSMGVV